MSFFLRLLIIFFFHVLFKQGDITLSGAFEPSLRSLFFSLYFIIYWMFFWRVCSLIYKKFIKSPYDKKVWYRKLSLVSIILVSFEIICSVIFNWGYFTADYYFFGRSLIEDVQFLNPQFFSTPFNFRSLYVNPEMIFGLLLLFLLVYGTHIFISSMKNVKEMEVIAARQKKESITAQYTALKNQIDPHFFFNSLSILSSLIHESTELSESYISHLSKHYRYILEMNSDNLVTINKELEFLNSYFFLIKIRHQDYIFLNVNLSENTLMFCKILPQSLQMLVENAIKHNIFKKDNPLYIEIFEDAGHIIVRNNVNKRKLLYESTGIGLQNIKNRYAIESDKSVHTEEINNFFTVKLPKLS